MRFFNEKNMKKIHARVNLDHPAPSKSSQKYLKKKLRLGIIIPNQKKTTPEKIDIDLEHNYRTTSISAHAYYTIKLTSFLMKKTPLFLAIFWDSLHLSAEKTWFEMALINYLYLPKSIQKVYRGVIFLYEGFVLFERAY